jgi:hypothetical protein
MNKAQEAPAWFRWFMLTAAGRVLLRCYWEILPNHVQHLHVSIMGLAAQVDELRARARRDRETIDLLVNKDLAQVEEIERLEGELARLRGDRMTMALALNLVDDAQTLSPWFRWAINESQWRGWQIADFIVSGPDDVARAALEAKAAEVEG